MLATNKYTPPFCCACGMYLNYRMRLQHFSSEDSSRLRWPRDLDSVKDLARLLSKYKNTHYGTVLSAVFITYVLYPFMGDGNL